MRCKISINKDVKKDMHNFKELKIWQKSIDLTKNIYTVTKTFPKEEQIGLSLQLRRAVISVASNIAEGAGRNSEKEFTQFLSISYGSLCEVMTQIIIAKEIGLINEIQSDDCLAKIDELQKMIFQLRKNIKLKINNKQDR